MTCLFTVVAIPYCLLLKCQHIIVVHHASQYINTYTYHVLLLFLTTHAGSATVWFWELVKMVRIVSIINELFISVIVM